MTWSTTTWRVATVCSATRRMACARNASKYARSTSSSTSARRAATSCCCESTRSVALAVRVGVRPKSVNIWDAENAVREPVENDGIVQSTRRNPRAVLRLCSRKAAEDRRKVRRFDLTHGLASGQHCVLTRANLRMVLNRPILGLFQRELLDVLCQNRRRHEQRRCATRTRMMSRRVIAPPEGRDDDGRRAGTRPER